MNASYEDIRSRIAEPPTWFDSNGTPRYGDFHPELCPDIYAREVCLLEIACQSCGERFMVEEHASPFSNLGKMGSLRKQIVKGTIHYGDPPRHRSEQCCAGDMMNCEDIRVVQFWHRPDISEWVRDPELEIYLPDGSDEATTSPMSNGTEPGDGIVPVEAKP